MVIVVVVKVFDDALDEGVGGVGLGCDARCEDVGCAEVAEGGDPSLVVGLAVFELACCCGGEIAADSVEEGVGLGVAFVETAEHVADFGGAVGAAAEAFVPAEASVGILHLGELVYVAEAVCLV